MKTTFCLLALAFVTPTLLQASSRADAVLLKGNAVVHDGLQVSVKGGASALCGDTRLTADEMVYDSRTGVLTCTGAVTIQVGGLSFESPVVTTNIQGKRIMSLSNSSIVSPGSYPADLNAGNQISPASRFESSYPRNETQLRLR